MPSVGLSLHRAHEMTSAAVSVPGCLSWSSELLFLLHLLIGPSHMIEIILKVM